MAEHRREADRDRERAARQAAQVDRRGEARAVTDDRDPVARKAHDRPLDRVIRRCVEMDRENPVAEALAGRGQRDGLHESGRAGTARRRRLHRDGREHRRFETVVAHVCGHADRGDRRLGAARRAEADDQVAGAAGGGHHAPGGRTPGGVLHAGRGFEEPLVQAPVGAVWLLAHVRPHLFPVGVRAAGERRRGIHDAGQGAVGLPERRRPRRR